MENKNYYSPYLIDLLPMRDVAQIEAYMNRVRALPKSLINLLVESDTATYLEDSLGPQFGLSEKQVEDLTRVIRDVLMCDLFIGDMTSEIGKRLGLPNDKALEIRNRIIAELFAPAIEDIKKVQREKFSRQGEAIPAAPAQQPAPQVKTNVNPNNVVNLRDK